MKRIAFALVSVLILTLALCPAQQLPSSTFCVVDSLIRPANGTQYGAGDAVNDSTTSVTKVLVFKNIPSNYGGDGFITMARIALDTNNVTTATFRLYLFDDSTGITRIADNSAYTLLAASVQHLIGYLDFGTPITGGTGSTLVTNEIVNQGFRFQTKSSSRDLYGTLVALGAYTPKWNGKIWVYLSGTRYN